MELSKLNVKKPPSQNPARWGLILPFIVFLVIISLYSVYWFQVSAQTKSRFDTAKSELARQGIVVKHDPIHIKGYPFRLFLPLKNLSIETKDKHSLFIADLALEAAAYAPQNWVMMARSDIVYTRRPTAPTEAELSVRISTKSLKASLTSLQKPVPDFALDGRQVKLTSENDLGGLLRFAERIQIYSRPSKTQKGLDILWITDQGVFGSLYGLDQSLGLKPVDIHLEATLLTDQPDAGIEWSRLQTQALRSEIKSTDYQIELKSTNLRLDANGRLEGPLELSFQGERAANLINGSAKPSKSSPLGLNQNGPINLVLNFSQGKTYLGPIQISKAPQLLVPETRESQQ